MEHVAAIIGAIGTLLGLVFGFYQYAFNKRTDYKIDKQKEDDRLRYEKEKSKISIVVGKLYAYLWELMFEIDADRVFIIQPHPLSDRQFISVSIEILRQGRDVSPQKDNFQFQKMSEWSGLMSKVSNEDWIVYRSVDEIKDMKIFTEAYRRGVKTLVFRRMLDNEGMWEGLLCAEYTHSRPDKLDFIKGKMEEKGILVSDILPEYKPEKKEENG